MKNLQVLTLDCFAILSREIVALYLHVYTPNLKCTKNDVNLLRNFICTINVHSSPGVLFSKGPGTFRARTHFRALFGCSFQVPKSISQNRPESVPNCLPIFSGIFSYLITATIMRLELDSLL